MSLEMQIGNPSGLTGECHVEPFRMPFPWDTNTPKGSNLVFIPNTVPDQRWPCVQVKDDHYMCKADFPNVGWTTYNGVVESEEDTPPPIIPPEECPKLFANLQRLKITGPTWDPNWSFHPAIGDGANDLVPQISFRTEADGAPIQVGPLPVSVEELLATPYRMEMLQVYKLVHQGAHIIVHVYYCINQADAAMRVAVELHYDGPNAQANIPFHSFHVRWTEEFATHLRHLNTIHTYEWDGVTGGFEWQAPLGQLPRTESLRFEGYLLARQWDASRIKTHPDPSKFEVCNKKLEQTDILLSATAQEEEERKLIRYMNVGPVDAVVDNTIPPFNVKVALPDSRRDSEFNWWQRQVAGVDGAKSIYARHRWTSNLRPRDPGTQNSQGHTVAAFTQGKHAALLLPQILWDTEDALMRRKNLFDADGDPYPPEKYTECDSWEQYFDTRFGTPPGLPMGGMSINYRQPWDNQHYSSPTAHAYWYTALPWIKAQMERDLFIDLSDTRITAPWAGAPREFRKARYYATAALALPEYKDKIIAMYNGIFPTFLNQTPALTETGYYKPLDIDSYNGQPVMVPGFDGLGLVGMYAMHKVLGSEFSQEVQDQLLPAILNGARTSIRACYRDLSDAGSHPYRMAYRHFMVQKADVGPDEPIPDAPLSEVATAGNTWVHDWGSIAHTILQKELPPEDEDRKKSEHIVGMTNPNMGDVLTAQFWAH